MSSEALDEVTLEYVSQVTFTLRTTIENHLTKVGVYNNWGVCLAVFENEETARQAVDNGRFDSDYLDRVIGRNFLFGE